MSSIGDIMSKMADALIEGCESLTEDGDVFDMVDQCATLRIERDEHYSINDYESDGRTSDYVRYRDPRCPRPDGFSGRAVKIQVDQSGYVWWEPYDDAAGYTDSSGAQHFDRWDELAPNKRASEQARVTDLIRDGFLLVGVILSERVIDSRGAEHWVEVGSDWVGGCDSVYPGLTLELFENATYGS